MRERLARVERKIDVVVTILVEFAGRRGGLRPQTRFSVQEAMGKEDGFLEPHRLARGGLDSGSESERDSSRGSARMLYRSVPKEGVVMGSARDEDS